MELKNYILSFLALMIAGGEAYLTSGYIATNYNVPEGTVFTLKTLAPSFSAILLALAAFIGLIPKVKTSLQEQGLSTAAYWLTVSVLILISILLIVAAFLSGSVEYNQFQASMPKTP
jgi:hypothetical protein